MCALLATGTSTVEKIRADIAVSEKDKADLRKFLDEFAVERVVNYRSAVLNEFDELVAAGAAFVPKPPIEAEVALKYKQNAEILRRKNLGEDFGSIAAALQVSRALVTRRVGILEMRTAITP